MTGLRWGIWAGVERYPVAHVVVTAAENAIVAAKAREAWEEMRSMPSGAFKYRIAGLEAVTGAELQACKLAM